MKTKILSPLRRDGYKAGMIMMLIALSTMLLTTACSNEDDVVNNAVNSQTVAHKGYALPVTVNVTRGEDATTRATYTDNGDGTGSLGFSAGDKLFVYGDYAGVAGNFAGTLDYDAGSGKFSGTIYTKNLYEGTIDDLLNGNYATLLPAGYESYDYLEIIEDENEYEDLLGENANNSFATSKKLAVEQLSYEHGEYTIGTGFVLEPQNAILNFTVTGFVPNTKVTASLSDGSPLFNIEGDVTTNGSGNATFAMGVSGSTDLNDFTLTVAGNPITLVSSSTPLAAGKIYNITRAVTPPTLASVFNDGATVLVKANTKSGNPNYWFGVTGTYNESTSEYATTSCGSSSSNTPKTVSMTKDGNNIVAFMQSNYNQITITFNTTNNTYKAIATSSTAPAAINTFTTLIVNGVDITSTLTAVPSETITLTGGSDMGENTFSGTHFQVTGGGGEDRITVNQWKNMVISAKTGKTIVDVVFSYAVDDMNLDKLTFSSGTFNGSNMVENVNATSLTVGSTSPAGTPFNGVTIYYSE